MTTFFVAGIPSSEGGQAEDAYRELRRHSQLLVGAPARARRIFKLNCRHEGSDCEIEVGRPLPPDGQPLPPESDVVTAIFDHGREEAYVVHTLLAAAAPVRIGRPVYSVTEFS
jgi:hypothetical protein